MSFHSMRQQDASSPDEMEIRMLYRHVLDGWNQHSAEAFAAPFAASGEVIGFDGSQMTGGAEIASTLGQIFADHVTAPYISKVRSVRLLSPEVAILSAIVGMVPPGQVDLNPAVNAHQTLVAAKRDGTWRIELFQTRLGQCVQRLRAVSWQALSACEQAAYQERLGALYARIADRAPSTGG